MPKQRTASKLDEFSPHEALDRAHLAASIFSDFVADHPFVQSILSLRAEAERLAEALGMFYQALGHARYPDAALQTPKALAAAVGMDEKTIRNFLRERFPADKPDQGNEWTIEDRHVAAVLSKWPSR